MHPTNLLLFLLQIYTNIGNPHAVGQHPITFYREVLALCDLPAEYGVDNPSITSAFPADAVERAKEMRKAIGPAGTGAYTNSQGILEFRQDVADYIAERDGHPAYPANIFLTNGASSAIEMVLNGLISDNRDAIMIPIPQYPIYSALIGRLGARQIGYYLDEDKSWAVSEEELQTRWDAAKEEGLNVKALAVSLRRSGKQSSHALQQYSHFYIDPTNSSISISPAYKSW